MAKDGTNRGGARIGAGRPRKSKAEKLLEGAEIPAEKIKSKFKPPSARSYLSEKQRDGSSTFARQIYRETFNWLALYDCAAEVNAQLVENFAQTMARHIQAEQELSRSGFLTRTPDGSITSNPLVKVSLEYLKAAQQIFFQLRRFVEENGTLGGVDTADAMEKILRLVDYQRR